MDAGIAKYVKQAAEREGVGLLSVVDACLRDKNVFSFGELLDLPNVQAMRADDKARLELFAYGTYDDYKAQRASGSVGPGLGADHLDKLKALTLVSFATVRKEMSYDALRGALDLSSDAAVEALVRDCIYAGVITATLDQRARLVEVSATTGRDVKVDEVDALLRRVDEWQTSVATVLGSVEEQLKQMSEAVKSREAKEATFARDYERALKRADDEATKAQGMQGGGGLMAMGAALGGGVTSALAGMMAGGGFGGMMPGMDDARGPRRQGSSRPRGY